MSPPVYDIWSCILRIICYPKLQILWKCWLQAQLFLIFLWSIRVKFKNQIKPQLRNVRTHFNYDPVLAWQVLSFQSHCHIDWEVDPPPKATNKHRVIRFVKYATDAFYVAIHSLYSLTTHAVNDPQYSITSNSLDGQRCNNNNVCSTSLVCYWTRVVPTELIKCSH